MAKAVSKKLTDSELYILNALSENKIFITSNHSLNSSFSWSLCDAGSDIADDKRLIKSDSEEIPTFLQANKAYDSLWKRQFLIRINKEKIADFLSEKRDFKVNFAWYDNLSVLSKEGKQFVQDNPELFTALKEKINAEKENSMIIVSKRCENNYTGRKEQFGAGAAYRVVRETTNRYYVAPAPEEYKITKNGNRHENFVEGYDNKMYIDKNHVLAIDVTPEQYSSMCKTTNQYIEQQNELNKQEENELRPIRERFEQRRKQSMAMYEDELKSAFDDTAKNTIKI